MNDVERILSQPPTAGVNLKDYYLHRLERLIRLRRDFEEHLNNLGVELLDRSIYATLRDCMDSGAGRRAQTLMKTLRRVSAKTRVRPE